VIAAAAILIAVIAAARSGVTTAVIHFATVAAAIVVAVIDGSPVCVSPFQCHTETKCYLYTMLNNKESCSPFEGRHSNYRCLSSFLITRCRSPTERNYSAIGRRLSGALGDFTACELRWLRRGEGR